MTNCAEDLYEEFPLMAFIFGLIADVQSCNKNEQWIYPIKKKNFYMYYKTIPVQNLGSRN